MPDRPRIVIIGAGFGGIEAAKGLRKAPADVTVVDRTNHHLFQPLLYQVATAGLSPAEIAAPIRAILRHNRNTEVILGEVTGVDLEANTVRVATPAVLTIGFDYLVVATGSQYNYFGHAEWERYAPALKSLADATEIRRRILLSFEQAETEPDPAHREALTTFVLVGGGPTGVELAGAIAELSHRAMAPDFRHVDPRKTRILLLEAGPRILSAFPESLSSAAQKELERLGVEVRTGQAVDCIDAEGVTAGGERIAARTVIWCAGVRGSPAGNWMDTPTDRAGRVVVKPDLSLPEHSNVFIIGDTAAVEGQPLPGVAPVAMQQGRFVAWLLTSRLNGYPEPKAFRYKDKGDLATVGRAFAILHKGRIRLSGLMAWLAWVVVHIWYLIGFQNRLQVLTQWAWAYFTFQRGARLVLPVERYSPPEQIRQ